jgi:thiol-disulfide isomerase/thioredoxin
MPGNAAVFFSTDRTKLITSSVDWLNIARPLGRLKSTFGVKSLTPGESAEINIPLGLFYNKIYEKVEKENVYVYWGVTVEIVDEAAARARDEKIRIAWNAGKKAPEEDELSPVISLPRIGGMLTLPKGTKLRADDTAAPAPTLSPSYHASVLKLLENSKDIIAVNKATIPAAIEAIKTKKYLFIYKSAHWCLPCRAFTQTLVAFYNKNYAAKGDFELIFVSSDRSQSEMNGYMQHERMPWAGLKLGCAAADTLKKKCRGDTIPCLMLLDENDKVIAETHSPKGKDLDPNTALNAYLKLHGEPPMPKVKPSMPKEKPPMPKEKPFYEKLFDDIQRGQVK